MTDEKHSPRVSVILPTYNRANVLGRAIRSVLAQTYTDLELIVVDDGSTDETAALLAGIEDPRLRVLVIGHTGSAAVARGAGIDMAKGHWLAFQDSDDEWLVDKLARQMQALERVPDDTGLVCSGYIIHHQDGRFRYQGADERMQRGEWGADNVYDFSFITPTWLLNRESYRQTGGFDRQMSNLEDWELIFRLYRSAGIVVLDEPLVLKHGGADSLNYRWDSRVKSLERIIEKHLSLWQDQPEVQARLFRELGILYCMNGNMGRGRKALRTSIRLCPHSRRSWVHFLASFSGSAGYQHLRGLTG